MCPPNPIPPDDAVRVVQRADKTFTYLTESAIVLQTSALESSVVLLESAVTLLESAITLEESAISILDAIESDADAIRVSTEIMDDWDESDRAKVNPIAGQAGVQADYGAVTANTQRSVEASAPTASTAQVDVITTATLISASDSTRRRLEIYNASNASVYLGPTNGVTTATGHELPSGANFTEPQYTGDVYGIVASGTKTVTTWKVT